MASFKELEKNKVQVEFKISAEAFNAALNRAYNKDKNKYNVPGFRRGKAPRKVIETYYGEMAFFETAFDEAFPEAYRAAIEETGLFTVSRPENVDIKSMSKEEGIELTVDVYTKPEVVLGDYKGIELEITKTEVTDEDVEKELGNRANQNARYIDVERAAQMGDKVIIDYSGSVDGVKFEGGTAEAQSLDLGSGMFIPGFEEQIVGMTAGQEGDINVTFPEQYHADNLAGKAAVFAIKVISVKEKQIPELNDEFAQDVSEFDTLEEYKADVRKTLETQAEARYNYQLEDAAVQKAVENAEVEIPACMIEDQIDYQMQEMEYRMMYQGFDFETYLKTTGATRESMREGYRPSATRRIKTQLVLDAICKAEALELTEEETDAAIAEMATNMGQDVEKYKAQINAEELDYVKDRALYNKVVTLVKDSAIVK